MIYIKELFPNPLGRDVGNEWIKLFNDGKETVDLRGWFIKDESGKSFEFAGFKISPAGEIKIDLSKTKIILNNDRDAVFLYNPAGEAVHKLSYDSPVEDEVVIASEFQIIKKNETMSTVPKIGENNNILATTSLDFAPFIIGFAVAVFMGIVAGFLIKKYSKQK